MGVPDLGPAMPVDWSQYSMAQMWAMLEPENEADHSAHVHAWLRAYQMLDQHHWHLVAIRDQVIGAWPPEGSPASQAFLHQMDAWIASVKESATACYGVALGLSDIADVLMGARKRVKVLMDQWSASPHGLDRPALTQQARQIMADTDQGVYDHAHRFSMPDTSDPYSPPAGERVGLDRLAALDPTGSTAGEPGGPGVIGGGFGTGRGTGPGVGGVGAGSGGGWGGPTGPVLAGGDPTGTGGPASGGRWGGASAPWGSGSGTPGSGLPPTTADGVIGWYDTPGYGATGRGAAGYGTGYDTAGRGAGSPGGRGAASDPHGPGGYDTGRGGSGSGGSGRGGPGSGGPGDTGQPPMIGGMGGGRRREDDEHFRSKVRVQWEVRKGIPPVLEPAPEPGPEAFDPGPGVIGIDIWPDQ